MITLLRTTAANEHFTQLTLQLDAELWEQYPDTQQEYDSHNKMDTAVKVILALEDEVPVGCGAFREFLPEEIEIKRMYVKPSHRGKGISKKILQALEKWAMENRFVQAKLETGIKQPEAIQLYKGAGYVPIPNYDPYKNMPESVCMGKKLVSP